MKKVKQLKSIWLSLSTLPLALVPIVVMISCSQKTTGGTSGDKSAKSKSAKSYDLDKINPEFFSSLKTFAEQNGLSKEKIDSITIDDLHKYTNGQDLGNNKNEIIEKAQNVMTSWAFKNNSNSKLMEGFQTWINNSGLQVFTSESQGRGPWIHDPKKGSSVYYRNDVVNIRNVSDFGGYDFYGSSFIDNSSKNREVVDFNNYAAPSKGDRFNDASFSPGNSFASAMYSNSSFSIFRSVKSGNYKSTIDKQTGERTFTDQEVEKVKLFQGLDLFVDGNKVDPAQGESYVDYDKTIDKLKDKSGLVTLSFKNNNKVVNYSKASNENVVNTNVAFKAKDLFYGFVRSFYTSKSFRETAKLNGEDLSKYLKKPTNSEMQNFINLFENKKAAEGFNNGNFYLIDLYGVDVPETLKANFASTNDSEFILKFKDFSPTSLYMFKNSSFISPFPKSKLLNVTRNPQSFTMSNLNIFNYGNPYSGTGSINVDGYFSIAPYILTKFSTTTGEYVNIKINKNYVDQDWANKSTSIQGYKTIIRNKAADSDAFSQQRLLGFQDAKKTGEYVLDFSIYNNKNLLKKVKKYEVVKKTISIGPSHSQMLLWNFAGYGDKGFNEKGRKMIWGNQDVQQIPNDPNAMQTFFSGTGAKLRSTIKSSINFYAMSQVLFPDQNMSFYPSISLEDEFKKSNVSESLVYPSWIQNVSELKDIYQSNLGDWKKAWKTDNFSSAAKTLDELAKMVNATSEEPAQIPIFKYIFIGSTPTPAQKLASERVIQVLNSLTKKVNFVDQDSYSFKDFIDHAITKRDAATIYSGYGPDYDGLGSINQQFLETYASGGFVALLQDTFAKK